jgi:hypothetical protein
MKLLLRIINHQAHTVPTNPKMLLGIRTVNNNSDSINMCGYVIHYNEKQTCLVYMTKYPRHNCNRPRMQNKIYEQLRKVKIMCETVLLSQKNLKIHAVSLIPHANYDTACTFYERFARPWQPLKGISSQNI